MSRFDDIQRDYLEAVNQVRASFGMNPTDNASDGAWEVMANHSPESFNSYSDNSYHRSRCDVHTLRSVLPARDQREDNRSPRRRQ